MTRIHNSVPPALMQAHCVCQTGNNDFACVFRMNLDWEYKRTENRIKNYYKCKSETRTYAVDDSWNMMAHGDAREGKWRGNWRMEWVAETLHTTSEHDVSSILPLMRSLRLPVVDWTDAPADLNGLVRFAERRNLVSARVPSHFNWPLLKPVPARRSNFGHF